MTLKNLRLWPHERTPGIPRNVDDLETVEFADVLDAIAEDQHLIRCAQVCFTGSEEDQAEQHDQGTTRPSSGRSRHGRRRRCSGRSQLTEKLTRLNRYLFLVTQSQRKNVWHPGFAFLAELALRSGAYLETCDIHRKKHLCRCYVLPELHKTISVPPRPFDARDATTQSRNLKHTKCHRLDPCSITKWESMCSRSLTQSACVSQS